MATDSTPTQMEMTSAPEQVDLTQPPALAPSQVEMQGGYKSIAFSKQGIEIGPCERTIEATVLSIGSKTYKIKGDVKVGLCGQKLWTFEGANGEKTLEFTRPGKCECCTKDLIRVSEGGTVVGRLARAGRSDNGCFKPEEVLYKAVDANGKTFSTIKKPKEECACRVVSKCCGALATPCVKGLACCVMCTGCAVGCMSCECEQCMECPTTCCTLGCEMFDPCFECFACGCGAITCGLCDCDPSCFAMFPLLAMVCCCNLMCLPCLMCCGETKTVEGQPLTWMTPASASDQADLTPLAQVGHTVMYYEKPSWKRTIAATEFKAKVPDGQDAAWSLLAFEPFLGIGTKVHKAAMKQAKREAKEAEGSS